MSNGNSGWRDLADDGAIGSSNSYAYIVDEQDSSDSTLSEDPAPGSLQAHSRESVDSSIPGRPQSGRSEYSMHAPESIEQPFHQTPTGHPSPQGTVEQPVHQSSTDEPSTQAAGTQWMQCDIPVQFPDGTFGYRRSFVLPQPQQPQRNLAPPPPAAIAAAHPQQGPYTEPSHRQYGKPLDVQPAPVTQGKHSSGDRNSQQQPYGEASMGTVSAKRQDSAPGRGMQGPPSYNKGLRSAHASVSHGRNLVRDGGSTRISPEQVSPNAPLHGGCGSMGDAVHNASSMIKGKDRDYSLSSGQHSRGFQSPRSASSMRPPVFTETQGSSTFRRSSPHTAQSTAYNNASFTAGSREVGPARHPESFSAAGAFILRDIHKKGLCVLLPVEYRMQEGLCLHVLGGQISKHKRESSTTTAAREVDEESGKIIGKSKIKQLLEHSYSKEWIQSGNYYLHIVKDSHNVFKGITKKYDRMWFRPAGAEPDSLFWAPVHLLMQADLRSNAPIRVQGQSFPLSQFLRRILSNASVRSTLYRLEHGDAASVPDAQFSGLVSHHRYASDQSRGFRHSGNKEWSAQGEPRYAQRGAIAPNSTDNTHFDSSSSDENEDQQLPPQSMVNKRQGLDHFRQEHSPEAMANVQTYQVDRVNVPQYMHGLEHSNGFTDQKDGVNVPQYKHGLEHSNGFSNQDTDGEGGLRGQELNAEIPEEEFFASNNQEVADRSFANPYEAASDSGSEEGNGPTGELVPRDEEERKPGTELSEVDELQREKEDSKHQERLEEMLQICNEENSKISQMWNCSRDKMVDQLLGSAWELNVNPPILPPSTIIEILDGQHRDSKFLEEEFKKHRPDQRIHAVRRVRCQARINEYEQHRSSLGKDCREVEPLYHGTPETWRATSICLDGFDMSGEVLHGRNEGDGVYTAVNPSLANKYANDKGSILYVRGLETKHHTKAVGDMRIFKRPKHLLPILVADYGPVDTYSIELDKVRRETENRKRRHEELEKEMKKKGEQFKRTMAGQCQKGMEVYCRQLRQIEYTLKNRNLDTEQLASLKQTLEREKRQFEEMLPIYHCKHKICQACQEKDFVLILADTGTGKSTQLPQYLVDEVANPGEARKVLVLQPRRVNAETLCRRVAKERQGKPGQEVGYSHGGGISVKQANVTRIEFMTHGLFAEIAQDPRKLLSEYWAVILDEAHERSIEIDLSFALLRKALEVSAQLQTDDQKKRFKVLVASATIGRESAQYLEYFQKSNSSAEQLNIPGQQFPVHVQHRDEFEPPMDDLGSSKQAKVMTHYAIQTALDVLTTTDEGSILVFLPGSRDIHQALETLKSEYASEARRKTMSRDPSSNKNTNDILSTKFGFRLILKPKTKTSERTSSRSQFSYAATSSSKSVTKDQIDVGVYPLHGNMSRLEREAVLRSDADRALIFCTNVAETGLTVPNVRYIIDTGLEREVKWNSELGMNQMSTRYITKSSMEQRSGRAGRTASGICVRLYSQDTARTMREKAAPSIQGTLNPKVYLRLKARDASVPLLEDVDSQGTQDCENALKHLHLLGEDSELSEDGRAVLDLGVDIRVARFLLACNSAGCLSYGVLVAAAMSVGEAMRFLPSKSQTGTEAEDEGAYQYIDPSGDHLTLLNILLMSETLEGEEYYRFCHENGFDMEIVTEVMLFRDTLANKLMKKGAPLPSYAKSDSEFQSIRNSLLQALCAAFNDHSMTPRHPGSNFDGKFARIGDESTLESTMDYLRQFKKQHQPSADDKQDTEEDADVTFQLSTKSTLWSIKSAPENIALYTQGILTEHSPKMPVVQLVSYVDVEHMDAACPSWCHANDFRSLAKKSVRVRNEIELTSEERRKMLEDNGKPKKEIERKVPKASLVLKEGSNVLEMCAPEAVMPEVERRVNRLRLKAPESATIKLPSNIDMGKLIGKQGRNKTALENEINNSTASILGHDSQEEQLVKLIIDSSTYTVTVKVNGKATLLLPVVVGKVKSAIFDTYEIDAGSLKVEAEGVNGTKMTENPRLMKLAVKQPPLAQGQTCADIDEAKLVLAHSAIWDAGGSVYGGFLRDWVVNGIQANDIDVGVPTAQHKDAEAAIKRRAADHGIEFKHSSANGQANALKFDFQQQEAQVDLTDPTKIKSAPPGVSSDVDNLTLNRGGQLQRKQDKPNLVSLDIALQHIHAKKFVFYYDVKSDPQRSMRRVKKLLGRGYKLLTRLPDPYQDQVAAQFPGLVTPSDKFTKQWWI